MNEWVRRLLYSDDNYPATLGDRKTGVLIIDIDGLSVPVFDANKEPEAAITFALTTMGEPFANTSCHWQFTASQKAISNQLYTRLFFLLDTPLALATIKAWAKTRQNDCCIDPSLYSPAQLIYVSSPNFMGLADWIANRNGLLKGSMDSLPAATLSSAAEKEDSQPIAASRSSTQAASKQPYYGMCVESFKNSARGQHWLALIGDHKGGEGFYPVIRSLTGSAARYCGSSLSKARLKQIVREHVWHSDSSNHSDDYLRNILSDKSLDSLIEGAIRKFARF
ncbi:hypothetical protein [Endozoicomonas sp. 2B-B]